MKNKALIGLIASATVGVAIATPTMVSNQSTTHNINKILMANNINTNSMTNEAVVINGNSNMNLYGLPNGKGIVSNLSSGEMLTILGQYQNGYCKVKVQETGAVGYINTVNMQNILNGTNDSLTTLSKSGQVVNVSSNVRLRNIPSINSNIIGHLTNGTNLNILGKQGQWYKVSVNGQIGFIYGEYINIGNVTNSSTFNSVVNVNRSNNSNSKVNTIKSNSNTILNISKSSKKTNNDSSVKKINKYKYIATDCNNVPIMSEANNSSSVLDKLISQTKVYVYSESNGWSYVNYKGIKGYIFSNELQSTQIEKGCGVCGILVYRTGYIPLSVNGAVNVMSKANSKSNVLNKLYAGDSFYVQMEGGGWASVVVNSKVGYIPSDDITYASPTSNSNNKPNATDKSNQKITIINL